jgi:hypothetical protein
MLNPSQKLVLDTFVNQASLTSVVEALVDCCIERASQLRIGYRDPVAARDWEQAAATLMHCAVSKSVRQVSRTKNPSQLGTAPRMLMERFP